jgi:two-component system sensor kinase FixL
MGTEGGDSASAAVVVAELRALLDAAVDAVIVADQHGRIVEFNPVAERLFGYSAAQMIGQAVNHLMPEPHRSAHDGYIQRYETTGEARIIGIGREVQALRADGTPFPIALSVGAIEGGTERRYIGLIRDLSIQRAAEEEAHRLQNRLAHVGRFSLMGEMAAGLAHELNQPLSAVVNYAQAGRRLAERESPEIASIRDCLSKIAEQALRAGHIIEKLRDFLRQQEVTKEKLSVNEVVRSTLGLIEADARTQGIPIRTDLTDALPAVEGDLVQLQQVLLNLTRNAVDAMTGGQENRDGVVIRTRGAGAKRVEVAVLDRGTGVSPDIADSIFHPFVTTKRGGLGVGLAISRTIIQAHDGELFHRENPGGGSIFGFELPAH